MSLLRLQLCPDPIADPPAQRAQSPGMRVTKTPSQPNADVTVSPMFEYTQDLKDGHLCSMKENLDWCDFSRTMGSQPRLRR